MYHIEMGGQWGNHPTPCNQLNAVIYGLGWIYFRQSY